MREDNNDNDDDDARKRSNSSNVFPLGKIKNGATTATKYVGHVVLSVWFKVR